MVEAFLESLYDIDSAKKRCNCLPACTSISYDYELSPSKYDQDYLRRLEPTYNPIKYNKLIQSIDFHSLK